MGLMCARVAEALPPHCDASEIATLSRGFHMDEADPAGGGVKTGGLSAPRSPKRPFAWDNWRAFVERERRFRWFIKHGSVRDGWTPSDPNDPHSRKYPKRALAATLPKKYRMFWPVLLDRPDYELMAESG